ncbi:chemokine-like receptor 1 [Megalops cyprinoides]|uniref:chemokine-like receptor 1 n=1 Tax=Megalops cyprinoides TaxID=118141 RepID=UPI001863A5F9|nr:chemokine-like receptor 1 [Megalops cyprinoides]
MEPDLNVYYSMEYPTDILPTAPEPQTSTIGAGSVILVIVNIIIFLLGISGNGIVIWISGVKMKRSVNTTWYLSLACSDFIFCACLPFSIVNMATSAWPFGLVMCKFIPLIMFLNMFSSIFLLVIISVDRCASVVFPVWVQNHRTVKAASVLVTLAWIVSVALSVPSLVFRDTKVEGHKTICYNNFGKGVPTHWNVVFSRFVCGFLIPFVIITLCYTIIILKLKNNRMTKSSKPFKVMSALIVTFFVCWLPYHIFVLLEVYNELHNHNIVTGLMVSATLVSANSTMNPFLYAFMGKDFKKTCSILSKIENAMSDDARTASKRQSCTQDSKVSTDPQGEMSAV